MQEIAAVKHEVGELRQEMRDEYHDLSQARTHACVGGLSQKGGHFLVAALTRAMCQDMRELHAALGVLLHRAEQLREARKAPQAELEGERPQSASAMKMLLLSQDEGPLEQDEGGNRSPSRGSGDRPGSRGSSTGLVEAWQEDWLGVDGEPNEIDVNWRPPERWSEERGAYLGPPKDAKEEKNPLERPDYGQVGGPA
jgi:hypothetical protein